MSRRFIGGAPDGGARGGAPGGGADIGARTLGHLARASRLNAWIYGHLRAGVGGDVLEVGSGIGSMSRQIAADARHLVLCDVASGYLEALRQDLGGPAASRVTGGPLGSRAAAARGAGLASLRCHRRGERARACDG